MKHCIVLVILACVLFVSIGIAEDAERFVFRNGITWGMSPEEVRNLESVKLATVGGNEDPDYSGLMTVDVAVSKYEANLGYDFKNDQLFMCSYTFQDGYQETYQVLDYLYGALSLKYGEGLETTFETLDYVANIVYGKYAHIPKYRLSGRIYLFTYVDGTDIYLCCDSKSSVVCVYYFNESLFEELYGLYNTDGL